MVLIVYETYQFHFELLNIGYAAYLTFFQFCKTAFPDISDQSISRMVGGLHVALYRPDDELKRLAKEAVRQGIAGTVTGATSAEELFAELRSNGGAAWVEDWERTADLWFLIATDPGHPGGYSHYDFASNLDGARRAGMRTRLFDVRDPAGSIEAIFADVALSRSDLPQAPRAFARSGAALGGDVRATVTRTLATATPRKSGRGPTAFRIPRP